MVRIGRHGFLAVAVVFHLIYIYSIFDIYFVSPIVHGMQQYSVDAPAPAQRLFLIVGDGLRADKCFQAHPDPDDPSKVRHLAPFVRSKVLNEGTFGVSHTRVPTESRPGHVALIAGLYEDVSAVTTGWKLNPVNFDSVFNQSRHTWSWGSPDILEMFKEGASDKNRVDAWMYDSEMEDFTQDAAQLDIWVFDRVKALFESARTNATLNAMLHQDKQVFFLHLLGLDTSGHAYRPYSREYLNNIKIVDDGVREISKVVNNFYKDDKTAWVFTADHGMSDWGSHGDGHPDNTRTPLVAWGSGVRKPVKVSQLSEGAKTGHEDGFSDDWDLSSVRRVDTAQADVAALMAYLVGVNFPSNSVGELPLEYLDADVPTLAAAAQTNAKQILEMYRVKEEQKKATQLNYKPYGPLANLTGELSKIDDLIRINAHQTAIHVSMDLIKTGLEGLRYLQTYDWLFLRTLITLGYLGWIAFALTTVVDTYVLHQTARADRTLFSTLFFGGILASLYTIFIIQHARLTYYPYAFFPVYFWEEVFVRRHSTLSALSSLSPNTPRSKRILNIALNLVLSLALLEAIVTGYFHREVFTVIYLLATTWPFFYGKTFVSANRIPVAGWILSCVMMSTFTLLSAVKTESFLLLAISGGIMFALGLLYLHFGPRLHPLSTRTRILLGLQTGMIGLSLVVTLSSVSSLQAKLGLPLGNQVLGWLILVGSLVLPFLHSRRSAITPTTTQTLFHLFLAFSPSFLLLTISYESFFHTAFSSLLTFWILLEKSLPASSSPLSLRRSMFFFYLLQSAFFSTGNIASISSFSLDSVYRLIPVFSPFAMGALLIYKLMVPFVMLSCALRSLGSGSSTAMLVSAVSDVVTLNFFWLVRDEGSWLEIGSTISHFCIGGGLGVFVGGLELVGGLMMVAAAGEKKVDEKEKDKKKKKK